MKFIDFGDLVEVTYDNGNQELVSKEEALELGYKPRQDIKITYQGEAYTANQFSRKTKISINAICRYYQKGYCTGEEIIDAYNK